MPQTLASASGQPGCGLWYYSRLSYAQTRLPILRILPVGGVLLTIFILVLALSPPDGSRPPLNTTVAAARGALLDRERHPEVRQFMILAALKRADELNRLRDLPDTPTRTEPSATVSPAEQPKVAGLPADRLDSDPDEPAAATETPSVSIQVEIGELPVAPKETTSATEKPEQAKPQREIRRRAHRPRRARTASGATSQRPFNLFEVLFAQSAQGQPTADLWHATAGSRPVSATGIWQPTGHPANARRAISRVASAHILVSATGIPGEIQKHFEASLRSIVVEAAAVETRRRRNARTMRSCATKLLRRAEPDVASRRG